MDADIWRPVQRYETHYEVSANGAVRRVLAGRGATAGRVLRQHDQGGYRAVQLCRRDVKRKIAVHILVASAFHGPRPRGNVVNHINLVKHDNRASNLEWVTPKGNARHAVRNGRAGGRVLAGEKNGRARLTAGQVSAIRRLKGIVGQRDLALLCGVSKSAIQFIHQGKHWREPKPAEWPEDLRVREWPEVTR